MGSLMAGWDSPVPDSKSGKHRMNWSFTKEEIEAYWKLKKKTEEEHLRAISLPSQRTVRGTYEDDGTELQSTGTIPSAKAKTEESLEQLINKNGWWTKSNWAFLNEPSLLDHPSNNYASQLHIANLSNSKADSRIVT